MEFEILAPAGSQESLIAGVRCGANAVYLGGKALNARRNAGNFDDEQLFEAVKYCHSHGVKVYQAVNTLCSDSEFKAAYNMIKKSLEAGVDAFIVQDLGLAHMIKKSFPQARLHASTQMSIMTPKGVEALKELGFSRAVLPREMTAEEIFEIRKSTDMELEIFVHGALCMSVSGQCLLSAMLGGRSGNRGLCAQPCRLPFSADNSRSCDLSLKDLSLIKNLKEIGRLGVVSLKIEGRMKRPEYVAAAVSAIKKAVNGNYDYKDEIDLKSVFSRSGFTDGYFADNRGRAMFGTRQKEDVISAANVLKGFSQLYDKENPLLPLDMDFYCKKGERVRLTASSLGKSVTVYGDIPETAVNKPITCESVKARLSKLGGTQFYAGRITAAVDEGLIIPVSKINALRRSAAEQLSNEDKRKVTALDFDFPEKSTKEVSPYYTARFSSAEQIPDRHPFKYIFIPLWSSIEDFIDCSAGVEIPRGLFGREQEITQKLVKLKKAGVKYALCGNLGSYSLAKQLGFMVFGDTGLNIFNSVSAGIIENPILSPELTVQQINSISANSKGAVVYGSIPLMLARNCPVKNNIGCEKCRKNGSLTDRKGISFPVVCSPYPCVEVLNSVPIYMAERMQELKVDFAHFYFSRESRQQAEQIISLYEQGASAPFDYTRGLYYRGVL